MSEQDDINRQMRERLSRLQRSRQQREARGSEKGSGNSESQNQESSNKETRIEELEKSLKQREETLTQLRNQIRTLQQQHNRELQSFEREQEELRQLQGNVIHDESNTGNSTHDVNNNSSEQSNATTDVNMNEQVMTDEEYARLLNDEFRREEQEEQERQSQQRPQHGSSSNDSLSDTEHPSADFGGLSFFSSPFGGHFGTASRGNSQGLTSFEQFFGNDDLLLSGGDPFQRSLIGGLRFPADMNVPRRDPHYRMRINPITGFPGLMFGGALMGDNMDYETLLHALPPAPRGAQQNDIEQLPIDTFKASKAKEEGNESKDDQNSSTNGQDKKRLQSGNKNKENAKKKSDEFNKCCICLEKFKDGDEIRRLPCLHIFHTTEIDEWLVRNHLCPICRTPIEQNDPNERIQRE